jgi:hypothetical protein
MALKSRRDWMGYVPELLSISPWISSSGSLIESAWKKGEIAKSLSGAYQSGRRSAWTPKEVSVRLYAPLLATPARKRSLWASRFAVMKAP